MKKEELSFIFENNGSFANKKEKFMKRHNRNITCQCNRNPGTLSWQIPRLLHFLLKCLGRRCSFWSWLLKIRKDLCRVACLCLIYIYIPYFLMKLHSFTLLLLIYFALNSSLLGIGFSFFKKGVYLNGLFCFFFLEINRFWNK